MLVVYVAHPIRDRRGPYYVEQNCRNAEAIAIRLWEMGAAVICPGLNTRLLDGRLPDNVWLTGDLAIIERCDLVVLAPGWTSSLGAQAEKAHAKHCGVPVLEWATQEPDIAQMIVDRDALEMKDAFVVI